MTLATVLIRSGKFEQAEELLVELEIGEKYEGELTGIYAALRKEQIQHKWDGILALIRQKQFSKAEQEIEPSLRKIKGYKHLQKLRSAMNACDQQQMLANAA